MSQVIIIYTFMRVHQAHMQKPYLGHVTVLTPAGFGQTNDNAHSGRIARSTDQCPQFMIEYLSKIQIIVVKISEKGF